MKQTLQNGIWHGQVSTLIDLNKLVMTLLFVAGVTACNKEEFYQKDYLDNPFSDNTVVTGGSNGGDTAGTDGSSQGGVSAGVTSGSTDGTTGGSSTGGSAAGGSTTGDSTSGSATGGSTTGGSTTGDSTSGSTAGGSTTGDSTSGSTSSGSTTGGSTTGSTAGGSTTGATSGGSTTGSTTGGVTYQDVSESFQQSAAQQKKIDIMWVIDNSGSMSDEQRALGENFDSFIHGFISKNADFKMAITTTDTSSSSKKGAMVSGSDTKLTSAKAAADPARFMDDFESLVKVGINGSGNEKGLEATEGFMQKYASSFIRPDAYLAVVIISDEEDQSSKSVKAYTDYLKSFKTNPGLVKVYTIVNTNDVNTGGNTIGHVRYQQASEETAGTMSNIMDRFDNVLLEMGDSIVNLLDSFALASAPVAGSLKVFVNGVETSAYTYDAVSHSIKFDAGNLPPVGAQVTVNYKKVM